MALCAKVACAGIGDSVAKITAVFDWKLAFHARGTLVNDFAALLSDATVSQLMANPRRDLAGIRLLATALMLNGVAMEIAGSSRPASGSEHLISHALDIKPGFYTILSERDYTDDLARILQTDPRLQGLFI